MHCGRRWWWWCLIYSSRRSHLRVAFLFTMKSKIVQYIFIIIFASAFFFFYFQASTYPLKVARWYQPIEAKLISNTAKKCSDNSSLTLLVESAVDKRGAYSAQVAFLSYEGELEHCEIGYKDGLFGTIVSHHHRYRYASTTKLVTAAAIFSLVKL